MAAAAVNRLPQERRMGRARWVSLLAVAFALRIAAVLRAEIIEHDGAVYCSLAAALVRGDVALGVSTIWPPLVPGAIALLAFLAQLVGYAPTPESLELCARLVAALTGTFLLVPLHSLARHLFGSRAAVIAVVLAAFHPRLIAYSGAALGEMPFALALVAGIALLAKAAAPAPPGAQAPQRFVAELFAGAAFGLAFLARPEAALFVAALLAASFFARRRQPWSARLGPWLIGGFAVVAAPYLMFLGVQLGHPSLGEKGPYNLWRAFKSEYALVYEPPHHVSQRVFESPELAAALPYERIHALGFIARKPAVVARRTLENLVRNLLSSLPLSMYYVVFVLALIGLGAARRPGAWLVVVPLAIAPLLYAPFSSDRRFFVPLVPLALVLAAAGIETLRAWFTTRLGAARGALAARALLGGLVLASLAYALGKGGIDDAPEHRAAGTWLAAHWKELEPSRPRPIVMSRKPWVGFYARGWFAELPEGTLTEVLARARRKRADVLVVDERWVSPTRPALVGLLDPAQAPREMQVLHVIESPRRLVLYDLRGLR